MAESSETPQFNLGKLLEHDKFHRLVWNQAELQKMIDETWEKLRYKFDENGHLKEERKPQRLPVSSLRRPALGTFKLNTRISFPRETQIFPPSRPNRYDMSFKAIEKRGWVSRRGGSVLGRGWYGPDEPRPIGGTVIHEHDDQRGFGGNRLRFADPNNPFDRGIRKGGRGPDGIGGPPPFTGYQSS